MHSALVERQQSTDGLCKRLSVLRVRLGSTVQDLPALRGENHKNLQTQAGDVQPFCSISVVHPEIFFFFMGMGILLSCLSGCS